MSNVNKINLISSIISFSDDIRDKFSRESVTTINTKCIAVFTETRSADHED